MHQRTAWNDSPAPATDSSLPAPLTPIVGREHEIALATALLSDPDVRLVTLTGPGGVGKTRLALHLVGKLAAGTAEVQFLPLADIDDPGLVLPTIARAIGLRGTDERPLIERIARLLRDRRTLLVLDNLEQVIAVAPTIAELLIACPGVTALVTSRAPLHITGEHELDVRPLRVPDPERLPPAAEVQRSEAVALFLDRLAAVRPSVVASDEDLPTIVSICHRLDGLPLALELAAARCRVLSLAALQAHLSHRLHLLTTGSRDLPRRLQTMRDAIAWSYALLTPEEQARFRRLSVFSGGFTLDAAESIDGAPEMVVIDGITALADQSLLHLPEESHSCGRLAMLETIREFGLERLRDAGEEDDIRDAHASWCLDLVARVKAAFWGMTPGNWRELVEPEHANLRAGFAWLMERDDPARALRLATDLEPFWWVLGHGVEGLGWLRRALDLAADAPADLRAEALVVLARLEERAQDYPAARVDADAALAIARRAGDAPGIARAIDMLALIALQSGDLDSARPLTDDAIARFRRLGDRGRLGWALCNRSVMPFPGDPDERARAAACCTEALTIFRNLDHRVGIGRALHGLADVETDTDDALAMHQESLAYLWLDGATSGLASSIEGIAVMAHRRGHSADAARLIGAAEAIRDTCAVYRAPYFLSDCDRAVAGMRDILGEHGFAAAHLEGQSMLPEDYLALATQPFASDPPEKLAGLTKRQREVLERIAAGQGNREIADDLYLSVRTVEDHVSNVLAKLGVASRAEAAATLRAASPRRPHDGPVPQATPLRDPRG